MLSYLFVKRFAVPHAGSNGSVIGPTCLPQLLSQMSHACLRARSTFKEKNEVQWTPAPLETLLDVEAIIEAWAAQGMVVHKAGFHHLLVVAPAWNPTCRRPLGCSHCQCSMDTARTASEYRLFP